MSNQLINVLLTTMALIIGVFNPIYIANKLAQFMTALYLL